MLEETRDRSSTSKHRGFLWRTYSQHYGTPTDTVRELPLNFGNNTRVSTISTLIQCNARHL